MIRKSTILLGAALILLGCAAYLGAQVDTGAVNGRVTDRDGMPIPGVSVTIIGKNIMSGKIATQTDTDGVYRFPRVPVGEYVIEYKMDGFKPAKRENISISMSSRINVNTTLEMASLTTEVAVTAKAPIIDQVKPSFNKTLDSKTLDILPINRGGQATEIANFNPGDERYGATMGSGWYGNAYLLDGADATDVGGGDVWLRPNYETVEEVEYTYGGAPAEYGDFSGSLVRMITKTGSNRFFGTLGFYFTNKDLVANNTNEEVGAWNTMNNTYDVSLGGPIVKDKIWFYVDAFLNPSKSYTAQTQKDSAYIYRQYTVKLTFNLSPKHRTNLSLFYEPNTARRWGSEDPYQEETCWVDMDLKIWQGALNHTSFLRENLIFDANVSYMWSRYFYPASIAGGEDIPQVYDYNTGWLRGGTGSLANTDQANLTAYGKLSWFVNMAGSHELKTGIEYQRGYRGSEIGYSGGMMIYDYGDGYRIAMMRDPYYSRQYVGRISTFIQDDWTIGKRLTASFGLRYDDMHGYIFDQKQPDGTVKEGPGSVAHFKCLAPRIALNYDLTGDGRTMARASWGRYYQTPPTGMFSGLNTAASTVYYGLDNGDGTWSIYRTYNATARAQDPNLKNYHNDLLTVSLEREIFRGTTIAINYFKKWSRDYYGSIPLHNYTPVQVWDSYAGEYVTMYQYVSPTSWYFCNIPASWNYYDNFDAFQVVINKRLTNKWYLNFSYHYEKSKGTAENGYNTDKSASYVHYGPQLTPNYLINQEGPLMYNSPHQFKLVSAYMLPWGITASTFVSLKEGNPWNRVLSISSTAVSATINAEPRGTHRYPWNFNIDLWLRKELRLKGSMALELSVQITNLLNANTILSRYVTTGNYQQAYYGDIRSIVSPRSAIFGAKIRF